jgi:hypothetical protein
MPGRTGRQPKGSSHQGPPLCHSFRAKARQKKAEGRAFVSRPFLVDPGYAAFG